MGKSILDGIEALLKAAPKAAKKAVKKAAPKAVELPMDEASRMARAKALGYDVDMPLYHGTTHDFTAFGGERGNIEGHFGAGHYFTSSPLDASKNYAGVGPDLTQRVELRSERLADDVLTSRDVSEEVAKRYANWRARKELVGDHEGAVLPVYLRGKTVDVRDRARGKPTTLELDWDHETAMRDARKHLGPNADEDAVRELADEIAYSKEPTGPLKDFMDHIRESADKYGYDARTVLSKIDDAVSDGYISASDLDKAMRNSDLMYAQHPETGELSGSDIIRKAFNAAGFDNILMDAKSAFPNMPNILPGTTHVVTSNPANIRSRFAAFDPAKRDSSDLLAGIGAGSLALPALNAPAEEGFADGGLKKRGIEAIAKFMERSKVRHPETGEPVRAYHITKENFDSFKPGGTDPELSGPATWLSLDPEYLPAAHNVGGFKDNAGVRQYKEGTNVMPVWADLRNPLHLDKDTLEWARKVYDAPELPYRLSPAARAKMIEDGHDSVFAYHPSDDKNWKLEEVISLHPERQLKSAISNSGEYDPSIPSIHRASGGVARLDNGGQMTDSEYENYRNRALGSRHVRTPDLVGMTKARPWQERLHEDALGTSRALGSVVGDIVDEAYEDPVKFGAGFAPFGMTALETYREGAPSAETVAFDTAFAGLPFAGRAARAVAPLVRRAALPTAATAVGMMMMPSDAEAAPKPRAITKIVDEIKGAARMPKVRVAKDLPELTGLASDYPAVIPPVPTIDKKTGKEYLAKTLSDEALAFKEARDAIRSNMESGYDPYFDPRARFDVNPKNYPSLDDSATLLMKKPETRAKWDADVGNPEARSRLSEAYERGLLQKQGSGDWYFMGQLENEFVKEYGPDVGRKLFKERFPDAMAATTGGADPTANLLMAHYGNFIRNKGAMVPTEGFNIPYPVGGRYVGGNMEQFNKMIASPEATGITLANPKRYNFAGNFIGNPKNPTIDEQMTGIIAGPGKKLDAPSAANYGHFERPVSELASDYGVTPRYFQEVAWAGGKDAITKGGYNARPMISHVNDAVQRTALLTGMTPKEVVRRALVRAEMPLYADGGKAPERELPSDTLDRLRKTYRTPGTSFTSENYREPMAMVNTKPDSRPQTTLQRLEAALR